MSQDDLAQFLKLVKKFSHAMLVTEKDGQLRSRPMAIGDVTSDGRIRFITRDNSPKLDELTENGHVNVAMQGDARFLSLSGEARLSKDRKLVDESWSASQAPWFSDGKDDPHVIALEVIPAYAEFWDRSDTGLVTRLLHLAAVDGDHGHIDFSRDQ